MTDQNPPVVPEDDRCAEVFKRTPIGKQVIKWHCKLPKGHEGAHQGATIHAATPVSAVEEARDRLYLTVFGPRARREKWTQNRHREELVQATLDLIVAVRAEERQQVEALIAQIDTLVAEERRYSGPWSAGQEEGPGGA